MHVHRLLLRRTIAWIGVALVLGCAYGLVATDRAAAWQSAPKIEVGMGEQNTAMFSSRYFAELGLRRARVIAPWDVALREPDAARLQEWLDAARAADVEPFVHFGVATGSKCPGSPCHLPTPAEYENAFRAFRARWPSLRVLGVWNEANHPSQPTWKRPEVAARYYNVVRRNCHECQVVAADVLDQRGYIRWVELFRRHADRPKIIGLHNYYDANRWRLHGTERLVRWLLRSGDEAVWLTETGGIVKYTSVPSALWRGSGGLKKGVHHDEQHGFYYDEERGSRAVDRLFELAKANRGRIRRLYFYHWLASSPDNNFDSGLIRADGTPRPGYFAFVRNLNSVYLRR